MYRKIKSKIYTSDAIKNTQRTDRENRTYFFVYVYFDRLNDNPTPYPAMFTHNQIIRAMDRARKNPEDIPVEKESVFKRIKNFLVGANPP